MEREELAGWLRLALTSGLGNAAARRLLAGFGLPGNVFNQPVAALEQVVTPAQAKALRTEPAQLQALFDATLEWLQGAEGSVGRRILTLADADYPSSLLNTEDPPLMLYLMGQVKTAWPAPVVFSISYRPLASS